MSAQHCGWSAFGTGINSAYGYEYVVYECINCGVSIGEWFEEGAWEELNFPEQYQIQNKRKVEKKTLYEEQNNLMSYVDQKHQQIKKDTYKVDCIANSKNQNDLVDYSSQLISLYSNPIMLVGRHPHHKPFIQTLTHLFNEEISELNFNLKTREDLRIHMSFQITQSLYVLNFIVEIMLIIESEEIISFKDEKRMIGKILNKLFPNNQKSNNLEYLSQLQKEWSS